MVVLGVALPADELARVLQDHASQQVAQERGRRRGDGRAFRAGPWVEVARRLRDPGYLSDCAQMPHDSLAQGPLLSCTEYAHRRGVGRGTVRRWAAAGRLTGATKVGAGWLIPADTPPPQDRRSRP